MRSVLFFVLVLISNFISAQSRITGGFKFGYYFNNSFEVKTLIDDIVVVNTKSGLDGFTLNAFCQKSVSKRFSLDGELGYSWNVGTSGPTLQLINAYKTRDSIEWLTSYTPSFNTIDLSSNIGYKITKFGELYFGISLKRLFMKNENGFVAIDEGKYKEEIRTEIRRINYQNELIDAVENSFEKVAIMNCFGMRFNLHHFLIDLNYQYSIQPISRFVKFQNQSYLFPMQMDRCAILIGYHF